MYSLSLLKRSPDFRRTNCIGGKTPKGDLGNTRSPFSLPLPPLPFAGSQRKTREGMILVRRGWVWFGFEASIRLSKLYFID